jgi:glutathione peroxidase
MNIFDFIVKNDHGNYIHLKEYEDKVLLVVNTATRCGLTPQYTALQKLYLRYKDEPFEILDFPCNQFLEQAPGTDEEISVFCSLHYGTTFPRFSKINVNGRNTDPLFAWLKTQVTESKGNAETRKFEKKIEQYTSGNKENDIKWNFEKFLIDRAGNVVGRYAPAYLPGDMTKDIETLLK